MKLKHEGGDVDMAGEYRIIWLNTSRDIVMQNPIQAITAIYLHQGPRLLCKPNQGTLRQGTGLPFFFFRCRMLSHTKTRADGGCWNLENLDWMSDKIVETPGEIRPRFYQINFCHRSATRNCFGLLLMSDSIMVNNACSEHFLLVWFSQSKAKIQFYIID